MKTVTPRSLAYVAVQVLNLLLPSQQLNKPNLVTLCPVKRRFLERERWMLQLHDILQQRHRLF